VTPTDLQGAALLALFSGVAPSEAYRGKRVAVSLWSNGWIDGFHGLTAAGRDALATWLTSDVKGPFVAAEKQPDLLIAEVRLLVGCLRAGGYFEGAIGDDPTTYVQTRGLGWIDAGFRVTPWGREALAVYLLRGLK
jgi:hypothetical protein